MRLMISSIMGMRLVSRLSLWLVVLPGPYSVCPRVLLGGACTSQPGCIPAPRILGRFVVSFPPIGPSQILPIGLEGSTTFLIRASGCETIHTSGYYHVCSTWAVSVNDPLTKLQNKTFFKYFFFHYATVMLLFKIFTSGVSTVAPQLESMRM